MKKIVLVFLLSCLFLTNCKKNNDDTGDIIGKWKLIEVRNTFAQIKIDYSQYNIVYEFKTDGILTVSGKTNDIQIQAGQLSAGVYNYFLNRRRETK